MRWLTYHPSRRRPWTEHNCFPKGAIKWWRENSYYTGRPLLIFVMSDDRKHITLIPQEDWNE